jgi:hypothetical protein
MLSSNDRMRLLPARLLQAAFLLGILLAFGQARALTIGDLNPVQLLGGGQLGFSQAAIDGAGLSVSKTADPSSNFLTAGDASLMPAPDLGITLGPLSPIYQNPQLAYANPLLPCQPGDACQTPANPFIADSTWTVTNNTEADLNDLYLVFTRVLLTGPTYPNLPVALDGDMIQILEYTSGPDRYLLAIVPLGSLDAGKQTEFTMRYIVGGDMPITLESAGPPMTYDQMLPPFGVLGIVNPIPEPGTAMLLAAGLVALAASKRSRA